MARFCHKPLYFNDDCLERCGVQTLLLPAVRVGHVLLWPRVVDAGEGVLRVPVFVCSVGRLLPISRSRASRLRHSTLYRLTVKVRRTLRSRRSASDCGSTIIFACPARP